MGSPHGFPQGPPHGFPRGPPHGFPQGAPCPWAPHGADIIFISKIILIYIFLLHISFFATLFIFCNTFYFVLKWKYFDIKWKYFAKNIIFLNNIGPMGGPGAWGPLGEPRGAPRGTHFSIGGRSVGRSVVLGRIGVIRKFAIKINKHLDFISIFRY